MILDSDVLIDIERREPQALAWLGSLPEPPAVAGFAAMELVAGCRNAHELRQVERLLRGFDILWPREADLQRALVDYMPLRLAHGIGVLDTLIAATAIGHGLTLVTLNERHFRVVPGLTTLQPY